MKIAAKHTADVKVLAAMLVVLLASTTKVVTMAQAHALGVAEMTDEEAVAVAEHLEAATAGVDQWLQHLGHATSPQPRAHWQWRATHGRAGTPLAGARRRLTGIPESNITAVVTGLAHAFASAAKQVSSMNGTGPLPRGTPTATRGDTPPPAAVSPELLTMLQQFQTAGGNLGSFAFVMDSLGRLGASGGGDSGSGSTGNATNSGSSKGNSGMMAGRTGILQKLGLGLPSGLSRDQIIAILSWLNNGLAADVAFVVGVPIAQIAFINALLAVLSATIAVVASALSVAVDGLNLAAAILALPPPPGLPPLGSAAAAAAAGGSGSASRSSSPSILGGAQLRDGTAVLGSLGSVMDRLAALGTTLSPMSSNVMRSAFGMVTAATNGQLTGQAAGSENSLLSQPLSSRLSAALSAMDMRPSTAARLQRGVEAALSPRITAPFKVLMTLLDWVDTALAGL